MDAQRSPVRPPGGDEDLEWLCRRRLLGSAGFPSYDCKTGEEIVFSLPHRLAEPEEQLLRFGISGDGGGERDLSEWP